MRNKKSVKILGIILAIIICACLGILIWYNTGKSAVKSTNGDIIRVEISGGTGTANIAKLLKEKNVIKSANAMAIYIKLNHITNLQAGKYDLDNSEDLTTILKHIQNGEVASDEIKVTFVEGKNMKYIAKIIADNTENTEDDVFDLLKDEEYINSLIEKYWFLSDVIKNEDIYYPLEGYLLPDTYIFENDKVDVKTIFNVMLNYMDKFLTENKDDITYDIHEIITLASMAELEGESYDDRAEIVGVFVNRLQKGMSLGSDVTTYYAVQKELSDGELTEKEINTQNSYNTRGPGMNQKLPVGPICNPSKDAILAAMKYTQTNNLYFVADKNKKVYFSESYEEQQNKIKQLKKSNLWYEY